MNITRIGPALQPPEPKPATREATTGNVIGAAGGALIGNAATTDVAEPGGTQTGAGASAGVQFEKAAASNLFAARPVADSVPGSKTADVLFAHAAKASATLLTQLDALDRGNEGKATLRGAIGGLRDGSLATLVAGGKMTTTGGYSVAFDATGATVSDPSGKTMARLNEAASPLSVADLLAGRQPANVSTNPFSVTDGDGAEIGLQALADAAEVVHHTLDAAADKAKSDLDAMSEMGELGSMRLQLTMDRRTKVLETLSNTLKKLSDTANSITQNLK